MLLLTSLYPIFVLVVVHVNSYVIIDLTRRTGTFVGNADCSRFTSTHSRNNKYHGIPPLVTSCNHKYLSSTPSDVESSTDDYDDVFYDANKSYSSTDERSSILDSLKSQFIELCASYDRGFGASTSARRKIDTMIQQIEKYNTAQNVASTILDSDSTQTTAGTTATTPHYSIVGNWRMIYTTAFDVLSLQASPVFITGAIYQVYDNNNNNQSSDTAPCITNIIDFIPRIQSISPSIIPNSLIRVKVQTSPCLPRSTTSTTSMYDKLSNRIGLIFDSVSIQPIQLLGIDVNLQYFLPLTINLPKLPNFGATTTNSKTSTTTTKTTTSPGYFDVSYLDHDLLIIRQNAPGGLFCLVRVDSIDP